MDAVNEIVQSMARFNVWGPIAWDDVLSRYKRTMLGPMWVILPQGLFIAGLYILHRASFGGASADFLPYLAVSLPTWSLIVTLLIDTTASMTGAKGYIESYPLPMAIHIVRAIARAFITFAHLLVVYVVVQLKMHHGFPPTILAAIPALALIAVFGFGAGLALGPLGARFRDLAPGIAALMTLGFVLTPVFWVPTAAQRTNPLLVYNPFYYLLEVVRQPMLGSWGQPHVWGVAAAIAVGCVAVGAVVYVRLRKTIIYWL